MRSSSSDSIENLDIVNILGLDSNSVVNNDNVPSSDECSWASWMYLIERLKSAKNNRQVLKDRADMIIHRLLEDLPFYPQPACGEEAAKLNALSLEQEIDRILDLPM